MKELNILIKAAFILPHPPIVIEAIGKGEEKKCLQVIEGFKEVANKIKAIKPKNIILITPHGPVFSDGMAISYDAFLEGNLKAFGHEDIVYHKKNNVNLVDRIIYESGKIDIPCLKLNDDNANYFEIEKHLDYGTIVPMSMIDEIYDDYELIHLTYGLFSSEKLYEMGMAIKNSVEALNEETVIIASGDLSHALLDGGPYAFHPSGKIYDQKVQELLMDKDTQGFISIAEGLRNEAQECGKRSIDIMLGTLDGSDYKVTQYAYEKPFGVGYLVMGFEDLVKDESQMRFEEILKSAKEQVRASILQESRFVSLARNAITHYLNDTEIIFDDRLTHEMLDVKAGTFVSIKKNGALRGCMGTIGATEENIALEIVANAIKAAFEDPRFPPIELDDLKDIQISVDVLQQPEVIEDASQLDPKKYGIIVTSNDKRGVLLPDLQSIDTVDEQIRIACQKGSIKPTDKVTIERFEVSRYR